MLGATPSPGSGNIGEFYNPHAIDVNRVGEKALVWMGFPRGLLITNRDNRQAAFAVGDTRGATATTTQVEYLEWFVTKVGGKIKKVTFTTETPEYWQEMFKFDPDRVLALYRDLVSPAVAAADLRTGTSYNPRNVWNTSRGIVHYIVTSPANTLGAAIGLAKRSVRLAAAHVRDNYEIPATSLAATSADPRVVTDVNMLARKGLSITGSEPIGFASRQLLANRQGQTRRGTAARLRGTCERRLLGQRHKDRRPADQVRRTPRGTHYCNDRRTGRNPSGLSPPRSNQPSSFRKDEAMPAKRNRERSVRRSGRSATRSLGTILSSLATAEGDVPRQERFSAVGTKFGAAAPAARVGRAARARDMAATSAEPVIEEAARKDIQGNIFPGFNKDYQHFLFYRIGKKASAKKWLNWIAQMISSMDEVLAFNRMYRTLRFRLGSKDVPIKATWVNLAVSWAAIATLTSKDTATQFGDESFRQGLAARSEYLGDPAKSTATGNKRKWQVGGPVTRQTFWSSLPAMNSHSLRTW